MKRRFIICVDDSSKEQQDALTQFLKDKKVGYWHWFSDVWLMTDPQRKWTASQLRNELESLLPAAHKLILQIDGESTWSGFGKTKMFDWLKQTWSKD